MSRLVALVIAACLAASGGGCSSCSTALLEGVLVADGRGGLAIQGEGGTTIPVDWPDGVRVGSDDGELVLTNSIGAPIAHQGEFVSMAGGVPGDGPTFAACGPVAVSASGSPPR
jgi:hypothetical protein